MWGQYQIRGKAIPKHPEPILIHVVADLISTFWCDGKFIIAMIHRTVALVEDPPFLNSPRADRGQSHQLCRESRRSLTNDAERCVTINNISALTPNRCRKTRAMHNNRKIQHVGRQVQAWKTSDKQVGPACDRQRLEPSERQVGKATQSVAGDKWGQKWGNKLGDKWQQVGDSGRQVNTTWPKAPTVGSKWETSYNHMAQR